MPESIAGAPAGAARIQAPRVDILVELSASVRRIHRSMIVLQKDVAIAKQDRIVVVVVCRAGIARMSLLRSVARANHAQWHAPFRMLLNSI